MYNLQDLELVGVEKDPEELKIEELWMSRIQILERQYDKHINKLEHKILDGKLNKRLIQTLQRQKKALQGQVNDFSAYTENLQWKLEKLKHDVNHREKKVEKLRADLEQAKYSLDETKTKIKSIEETAKISIKENEKMKRQFGKVLLQKSGVETVLNDREAKLIQVNQIQNSLENENKSLKVKLQKTIENQAIKKESLQQNMFSNEDMRKVFFGWRETQEEQLYKARKQVQRLVNELNTEKEAVKEQNRQILIRNKQSNKLQEQLSQYVSKLDKANIEAKQWKKEAEITKRLLQNFERTQNISTLKTEKISLPKNRSEIAQINHRLLSMEKQLQQLETKKEGLAGQIQVMTTLYNSLIRIYQHNLRERKIFGETTSNQKYCRRNRPETFEQYKQTIIHKEMKMKSLENKLFQTEREANVLRYKLKEQSMLNTKIVQSKRELIQSELQKQKLEYETKQTVKKLAEAVNWTNLKHGLQKQINEIQNLRNSLPPIPISKIPKPDELLQNTASLEKKLWKLGDDLTFVEKRQEMLQAMKIDDDGEENDEDVTEKSEDKETNKSAISFLEDDSSSTSTSDPNTDEHANQNDEFDSFESEEDVSVEGQGLIDTQSQELN